MGCNPSGFNISNAEKVGQPETGARSQGRLQVTDACRHGPRRLPGLPSKATFPRAVRGGCRIAPPAGILPALANRNRDILQKTLPTTKGESRADFRWRPAACCSTRRTLPTAVSGKHSTITPARSWRAIRTAAFLQWKLMVVLIIFRSIC